jgi:hypothetical protein
MPDDDVYIVHMGHPTDPFDYGTACGAPWPDGPGPLDPGQQQLVMVHRLLEAEDRLPERTPRADPRYRQQAPSARLTEPVQ